ncbi:hypothetical protein [Rhizobium leguminosarum]|uniref:hypothetical protein n=1 Tax=Rhizobium leguminosarum TaxID=384 RepID=UPI00140FACBB|nr:hypothetical protein [Rhizobium leguminosarum]QIO68195.1 hypothetical protein HA462_25205 [Rhizobium leguminosarum bv. trifolii]
MRRNGIAHPASAFYDADRWSETELERFDADPAFTVRVVDETAENVKTDTDFRLAVDTEVARQVEALKASLEAGFANAVKDAVAEKTAELQAGHDNAMDQAGKDLAAANGKITTLEKQLADAKKKATAEK